MHTSLCCALLAKKNVGFSLDYTIIYLWALYGFLPHVYEAIGGNKFMEEAANSYIVERTIEVALKFPCL